MVGKSADQDDNQMRWCGTCRNIELHSINDDINEKGAEIGEKHERCVR